MVSLHKKRGGGENNPQFKNKLAIAFIYVYIVSSPSCNLQTIDTYIKLITIVSLFFTLSYLINQYRPSAFGVISFQIQILLTYKIKKLETYK
ncbi:hypothetical protein EDC94DRAFT_126241 [Helicostylum pulchrum]|nr:hypothetical protein EDC94DRAFT_126241 [Helicostylum pulchrum]